MNPTSKAFEDAKRSILSNVTNSEDRLSVMKIPIEGETKEVTATGASSGAYTPKLSLFADEAPKTQSKGGEVSEDELIGGKSDGMSLQDIAYKHVGGSKKDEKIKLKISKMIDHLSKQLELGVRIEKEHTKNTNLAKEIAMDHLFEDPNYYTKLDKIEKGEFKEATSSASSGSYVGTSFLAKSQSKKDWRGASKPQYKGGKFVRVKKKCKTFPYCNQGDIKALDLWEDDKLTEAIKNVAKKKNIHENVVRAIILHEIEEKLFSK
jgi:hypothetical protein